MSEEDTKVANIFDKDIENFDKDLNKMIEHLNIVIATHNKQVEEIERLKEELEIEKNISDGMLEAIDKAIDYIQNHQLVFELSSKKQIQYWFDMFYKDLLDILKENK